MITKTQFVTIDNQLRLVLFGLECALDVEFAPAVVEQIFTHSHSLRGDDKDKRYTLWSEPKLKVSGVVEAYEPDDVLLTVEANKPFSPSLPAIVERAKYQYYRLERWWDSELLFVHPI